MFGSNESGGRTSLIVGTVKTVAIIAGISYAAANWLSSGGLDKGELSRIASRATALDPVTTGSITLRGGTVKLDPCVAPTR